MYSFSRLAILLLPASHLISDSWANALPPDAKALLARQATGGQSPQGTEDQSSNNPSTPRPGDTGASTPVNQNGPTAGGAPEEPIEYIEQLVAEGRKTFEASPPLAITLAALEWSDQQCAETNNKRRSLAEDHSLEKRARPSDALFTAGQALRIGMGESGFLTWISNSYGIGTFGLCGCSAMAIVGNAGSIVAHISPNPKVLTEQLIQIFTLYQQHLRDGETPRAYFFPPASEDGAVMVAPFQDIIKEFITFMGFGLVQNTYQFNSDGTARDGTLIVRKVVDLVLVYLNDRVVDQFRP